MPQNQVSEKQSAKPMVASFLLHSLIVIALLLWVRPMGNVAQGEPDREVSVVLTDQRAEDTEYLTEQEQTPETNQDADSAENSPSDPASEPAPDLDFSKTPKESLVVPTEGIQADANEMTNKASSPNQSQYELTAEDLKMIAADQRLLKSREPVGDPASISLFGTGQLKGRNFVFVLDRSQSMGQGGLGVLSRAQKEISKAVDALEANHKFQIVAYHNRTITMTRRQMLVANAANKKMVPEFISRLAAFGSTSHEKALVAALTFRPDVVVFMTDGGYPLLNAGQLKTLQLMAGNRTGERGTEIHCVQFGSGPLQVQKNFMTDMALQNHGTFRYINVNDWDSK